MSLHKLGMRNRVFARRRQQQMSARGLYLRSKSKKPPTGRNLRRILVLVSGGPEFGLFATPALRALRAAYPGARIVVASGAAAGSMLRGSEDLDDLRIMPSLEMEPGRASSRQPRKSVATLKAERHEVALVMAPAYWQAALLAVRADIPHRLGLDAYGSDRFLTYGIPRQTDEHAITHNMRLVEMLVGALPVVSARLRFIPDDSAIELAQRSLLRGLLNETRPIVAILPGDGTQPEHWGREQWAFVADQLILQHGAQVVIAADIDTRQTVAAGMRFTPMSLDRPRDPSILAALFARCSLVMGSYSADMHLAGALERPTVVLYGPHDATYTGVWGEAMQHRVLRSDMLCAACNLPDWQTDVLANHPCVREIASYDVLNAALKILKAAVAA